MPVSDPANGSVILDADGSFSYIPDAGISGTDSFSYRARDAAGAESDVAEVTITVRAAADAIVFASSRTGNGDIYTLDPNGGGVPQLASGNAVDAEPAWSPDRQKLAFTSTRDGNVELYVMDAGGNVVRLTSHPGGRHLPRLVPGRRQDRVRRHPPGWQVRHLHHGRGRRRERDQAYHPCGGGHLPRVVSRRSQNRLLKLSHRQRRHLHDDPSGTNQTLPTTSSGIETEPDWSGSTIAFSTKRHGTLNFELYTIDADGTNATRLTNNPALDLLPDW